MTLPLKIYDSLANKKKIFTPLSEGCVSMYVCGPTTYDTAHLGHARSAIVFDMIRRCFQWLGFDVTFVRNITDVDDKIIARANERKQDPLVLAHHYAEKYNNDMEKLSVLPPTIEPYVSTHINDIISLIETLIEQNKAYQIEGDVYYDVATFASYGTLSGQSPQDLRTGTRIQVNTRKKNTIDFALWKSAKPNEPSWDSPWGKGRPGWHIECSAMSYKHLGDCFDIHGGGQDLLFPHHENEMAQSQGALGTDTFARYWMHNGLITINDEKMSKSLDNFFTIDEVLNQHHPETVRFHMMAYHYRSPLQLVLAQEKEQVVFVDLDHADKRLSYFYTTIKNSLEYLAKQNDISEQSELDPIVQTLEKEIKTAILDDFNTPIVVALLGDLAKKINKDLDSPNPSSSWNGILKQRTEFLQTIGRIILGVLHCNPTDFLSERRHRLAIRQNLDIAFIESQIKQRTKARAERNFEQSDIIRNTLEKQGVFLLDKVDETIWYIQE